MLSRSRIKLPDSRLRENDEAPSATILQEKDATKWQPTKPLLRKTTHFATIRAVQRVVDPRIEALTPPVHPSVRPGPGHKRSLCPLPYSGPTGLVWPILVLLFSEAEGQYRTTAAASRPRRCPGGPGDNRPLGAGCCSGGGGPRRDCGRAGWGINGAARGSAGPRGT